MNLWKDREHALDSLVEGTAWAALVTDLELQASAIARTRLSARLSYLNDTTTRWSAQARRLREQATPISLEETETLEVLIRSVDDWRLHQEGAGFLSVNRDLVRFA